ncbi:hypothetical protein ACFU5N_18120 [Streptomyces albidoflavus]
MSVREDRLEAFRRDPHPVLDVVSTDTTVAALYERLGRELTGTVEQRWGRTSCHVALPTPRSPSA